MSHPIIPIFGAGESGIGAALLAVRQGLEPWVTDAGEIREDRAEALKAAGIAFESGGHDLNRAMAIAGHGGYRHQEPWHSGECSFNGSTA